GQMQSPGDDLKPGDNRFSSENYRTIHFVVDLPVRLPNELLELTPPHARTLGPIVFVLCEFQLVDQQTEASNELGEASHAKYKEPPSAAVRRGPKPGTRGNPPPPAGPLQAPPREEWVFGAPPAALLRRDSCSIE